MTTTTLFLGDLIETQFNRCANARLANRHLTPRPGVPPIMASRPKGTMTTGIRPFRKSSAWDDFGDEVRKFLS